MDSWGTILLGWVVALAVPALYGAWILLRARVLARQLHLGGTADQGPLAGVDGGPPGETPVS